MSWQQSPSTRSDLTPDQQQVVQQQQQHQSLNQSPITTPILQQTPRPHPQSQQQAQSHFPDQSPSLDDLENPRKRKKSSATVGGDEYSDDVATQRPRKDGVKRACNQCRQQKLRCDVITEPDYVSCRRCIKLNFNCAIDPGFKRQEKRQQVADLERELISLKAENAELKAGMPHGLANISMTANRTSSGHVHPASGSFAGPNEEAASRSLLDLAQGHGTPHNATLSTPSTTQLGKVSLTHEEIEQLRSTFMARYHPHLPILSPDVPLATYHELSPLLYWTIITVASRRYRARPDLLSRLKPHLHELLWETIGLVPQTYHAVKALALLCAWPLPISSTSSDPTMIVCGAMVQLAMQFGLHRPSHAQDFSRIKLELREEDVKDRVNTWAAVNICAQDVSTGYGMPQVSRWNWFSHGPHLSKIHPTLRNRCVIARFVDKVTRALYTMTQDTILQRDETQRAMTIDMFTGDFEDEMASVKQNPNAIEQLHLQIAFLHLRLSAFFDSPSAPSYRADLAALYVAATTFLKSFLGLPVDADGRSQRPPNDPPGAPFATNFIMQMVLAAGFTLMKLLNSFFADQVDVHAGRSIFLQTVSALRSISVVQNDLAQRLAEVLAQLWQASGAGNPRQSSHALNVETGSDAKAEIDGSLQIKVRCRMSMSLVFDSVWRWKERFGASRNLDRMVEHPTQPDGPMAAGTGGPSSSNANTGGTSTPASGGGSASVNGGAGGNIAAAQALLQHQQHQHQLQQQQQHQSQQQQHHQIVNPLGGAEGNGVFNADLLNSFSASVLPIPNGDLSSFGSWDNSLFGPNAPFDSLGWALDGFLEMPFGNEYGFA